ncbi:MAG: hypothetical protein LBT97_03825 [Planctomycetota bacterium]|jgi:TRAP-type C4-dicarboxylate transport system permease small subunit|nr:hypothetical protein [Planctomycetota bacterium]
MEISEEAAAALFFSIQAGKIHLQGQCPYQYQSRPYFSSEPPIGLFLMLIALGFVMGFGAHKLMSWKVPSLYSKN